MWQTILLSLLAGAMGANSTPHLVKGITKETYPNVFGGSPVSNLVAGWAAWRRCWCTGHIQSATHSGHWPPEPWVPYSWDVPCFGPCNRSNAR
jgi:hypothetical protein